MTIEAAADSLHRLVLHASARVRIEAGYFTMGSDAAGLQYALELCRAHSGRRSVCQPEAFAHEQPQHRVYLRSYRIDRREVSQGDYRRCVDANRCTPSRLSSADARLGADDQPVVGIDATQAERYCAWVGGRLPTEAQWERAARGGGSRHFPWGYVYNSRVANHGGTDGAPDAHDGFRFAASVGAFGDGTSPHGLLNMAGNVWELTADAYRPDVYTEALRVDPAPVTPAPGVQLPERAIRGGSWGSPPYTLRVSHRQRLPADAREPDVGFRCVY